MPSGGRGRASSAAAATATASAAAAAPPPLSRLPPPAGAPPSEFLAWLMRPPPRGAPMVECLITRERRGLSLFPIYRMYVQCDDGDALVVVARRRKRADGHSFHLSTDADDLTSRGPSYVGKLRSNLVGSEWMLYDGGLVSFEAAARLGGGGGAARAGHGRLPAECRWRRRAAPRPRDAARARRRHRRAARRAPVVGRRDAAGGAKANRLLVKDHIFLASKEPKLNPATARTRSTSRGA